MITHPTKNCHYDESTENNFLMSTKKALARAVSIQYGISDML
jgi:hypothetical protein